MKIFLIKTVLFFGIISLGLFCLYAILDADQATIGDVRYVKTQSVLNKDKQYDALLIGSSRVFDIGNISDCNYTIFNYGVIQGLPADYAAFIKHTRENQPIKKIIVGLDFYGSSKKGLNDIKASWKPSEEYISKVNQDNPFKRFLSIYDFSRFKRLINYELLGNNPFERPTDTDPKNDEARKTWNKPFWTIYVNAYTSYIFNEDLPKIYGNIKEAAGDTELVVYVTPISDPLFQLLTDKGLVDDYERFLRTAVQSFGEVHNFMERNEFTNAPHNFKDESHLTNNNLHSLICQLANNKKEGNLMWTALSADNIDTYIKEKSYLKHGYYIEQSANGKSKPTTGN